MTSLTHLYGLVSTVPAATIFTPLIITLIFFHKPLIHGCISSVKNTLYAVKLVCLSILHTASALMIYSWQASNLLLAITITPFQLFPFYNLYGTATLTLILDIIPALANRISPYHTWQFFRNPIYTITSSITHFSHFITSPFQAFYHYLRGQHHVPSTQPYPQGDVSTTVIGENHTSTSASRLENEDNSHAASLPSRPAQNQLSAVTLSISTAPVEPSPPRHQAEQSNPTTPVRNKPTQAPIALSQATHKPSSQPPTSWFNRAISTSMQAWFYMAGLTLNTGKKLAQTLRFFLWLLLLQCPHYLGKVIFFLANTLIRHTLGIFTRLLQAALATMRSLGNLSYLFFHSLPGFARSSMHYVNSYQFFQHVLLAITLIQTRAINLSILGVYTSLGFNSYLTTAALSLSCPFLILGLYKLNHNLLSTIRQKVFHGPPLPYPSQLYFLIGFAVTSTATYCATVITSIFMTLSRLARALPNNLYQTRQDPPSQTGNLHDLYEDIVPANIRSSWESTLRSNFTVAHGNQPTFNTSSFFPSLVNTLATPSQHLAPISLLDQIKDKDKTWPCTDEMLSHVDESTKAALQNTQALICPITLDLIHQPIICSDGNTYEKKELLSWLKKHRNISPLTREPIVSLSPNRLYIQTLQQAIHLHQAGQTLPDTTVYTSHPAHTISKA